MSDFDSCQSNHTHKDGLHNREACARSTLPFDIGYMKCVYEWAGVRYVITKFSLIDSLPNFFTHDAPQRALRARESSAMKEPYAHVVTSLFALNKCRVAELRHKLSKR